MARVFSVAWRKVSAASRALSAATQGFGGLALYL